MSSPVLVSLDGDVQRQGVRVSVEDWMDAGSRSFATTPDRVKAAAYQAALACGWKDVGLTKLMVDTWGPRVDEDQARFTLSLLKELAQEFPLEVEEVKTEGVAPPVFKVQGCDKTIPFPT